MKSISDKVFSVENSTENDLTEFGLRPNRRLFAYIRETFAETRMPMSGIRPRPCDFRPQPLKRSRTFHCKGY